MAKKRQRTDAERRVRQSERLSRLFRVVRCIMGPGRWDADALAHGLEVGERTVHRLLQTLAMAGVPWYFCRENECYRVRPGFRFPGMDVRGANADDPKARAQILVASNKLLRDLIAFSESLRQFCAILERSDVHPLGATGPS